MGFWVGVERGLDHLISEKKYREEKEERLAKERAAQQRADQLFQWKVEDREEAKADRDLDRRLKLFEIVQENGGASMAFGGTKNTTKGSLASDHDLAWVAQKVKGLDGAEEYLAKVASKPGMSSKIRERFQGVAKKRGQEGYAANSFGNNLIEMFPIYQTELDNPKFVEGLSNTGDIFAAITEADLGDPDQYFNLIRKAYAAGQKPTITLTSFGAGEDVDYLPSDKHYKVQQETFDKAVVGLLKMQADAAQEEGDLKTSADLRLLIEKYDPVENPYQYHLAIKAVGKEAFKELEFLRNRKSPFFQNIEENPYLLSARAIVDPMGDEAPSGPTQEDQDAAVGQQLTGLVDSGTLSEEQVKSLVVIYTTEGLDAYEEELNRLVPRAN